MASLVYNTTMDKSAYGGEIDLWRQMANFSCPWQVSVSNNRRQAGNTEEQDPGLDSRSARDDWISGEHKAVLVLSCDGMLHHSAAQQVNGLES